MDSEPKLVKFPFPCRERVGGEIDFRKSVMGYSFCLLLIG